MKQYLTNRRAFLVVCSMVTCIVIFNRCISNPGEKKEAITHPNGHQYAGSEACRNCHRAICDSFVRTAHYLTSGLASKEYIKGSFREGENVFAFDADRKVVMEEEGDELFQTAYIRGKKERSQRFDMVMGSGKKGQTYLYWRGRELFQLPISYFASSHAWANSPGFSPAKISFDRSIEVRCMECHSTYAKEVFTSEYIPSQIIYGVSCERCHGPGAGHVEFHTQHPSEKHGKFIVNPANLQRLQGLDVCALCHSGTMASMKDAFSFLPGDTLSHYFVRNTAHIDSSRLDVHANQYGLLTASKCFRVSETMNCSTCHNTHVKESGDLVAYATKCMGCHTESNHNVCRLQPPAGFSMTANCVNCHMPVKASKNLTLLVAGQGSVSPELVRSHLIAVYPAESKKLLLLNGFR
ncbi:MAG TPA: multiheme c-type cytochrome [Puia sp.]|nr:multiheme c-type cytochrome [Puia sp.]